MSSVDRISINRSEPNYPLEEERKRQLARRLALESREVKRLVLPPIESQSRLAAKRALDDRRQSSDLAEIGTHAGQDADAAYGLEAELAALAIGSAGNGSATSGKDSNGPLSPRYLGQQAVPAGKEANVQSQVGRKGGDAAAAGTVASDDQKAAAVAEAAGMGDAKAADAANHADARASANAIWLQKLDAAIGESRIASPEGADHPLENVLEQLLQELQARAADSAPLSPDLKAALDALASKRIASFIADADLANHSRLQGSFRFLEAFVQTTKSKAADELETATMTDQPNHMAEPSHPAKTASEPGNKADAVARQASEAAQETVAPARDRQTLYEFLELLSQVATSGSPLALQQLAQARKANPQDALLRLAAAGDQAVMLFTPEISRRFDQIGARIERDGKKSARANMLAEAVATERQWMQSVIDQVDSMVGFNALRQRSEQEQREKNLGETLPQLVLQKT